ncbi:hypothetical protein [Stutzerimonas stutzeri]|uniref:hypothetical protein n=1 Tax=Stutzerimonas stutzeri TaxID=316 RepID=UPI00210F1275|nr:hypothetical protein [Stutzerimonas stutzeri]MCQ4261205.1 hypothetical protein [Stutzerimonas stutzeri]
MPKPWIDTWGQKVKVLDNRSGLKGTKINNYMLAQLSACTSIDELQFTGGPDPLDLSLIAHLPLKILEIENSRLMSLEPLRALKHLIILELDNCGALDFSVLQDLKSLRILRLRKNKLRCVPAHFHLPELAIFDLTDNKITDTEFSRNFPELEELHIGSSTKINGHRTIKFKQREETPAAFFVEEREFRKKVKELEQKLSSSDLEALTSEEDSRLLGSAIYLAMYERRNVEWIAENIVNIPDRERAIEMMGCLLSNNRNEPAQMMLNGLARVADASAGLVTEALARDYLADRPVAPPYRASTAHTLGMQFAERNASPHLTALFRWYFEQYEKFSDPLLFYYKHLVQAAPKTGSRELVQPIMNLLNLDKKIVNQEKTLKKYCLATIAKLGNAEDIPALNARMNLADEPADVVTAYEAAVKRLAGRPA